MDIKRKDLRGTCFYYMFLYTYRFLKKYINGIPGVGYTWNWIPTALQEAQCLFLQYEKAPLIEALLRACMDELKRKMQYIAEQSKNGLWIIPEQFDCTFSQSRYWDDFQKFWNLFCTYYPYAEEAAASGKDKDEEFWQSFMKEAARIGDPKEGEKDRFLQDLILAGIDEAERSYNAAKGSPQAA